MPIELDAKFPSLPQLEKDYARMPSRLNSAIVNALGRAGEEVKRFALEEPIKKGRKPAWRGNMVKSILTIVDERRLTARVGPNKSVAPYASAIEYGTKKANPPWPQIKAWAESKKLGGVAWLIYRKLRSEGITPNPFLQRAFKGSKSAVSKRFEVALASELRRSS